MYQTQQKIDEVDIRRYKQCFALGKYYLPRCEYINRMTGLTLHNIAKVARMTKMKPIDLALCVKNRVSF